MSQSDKAQLAENRRRTADHISRAVTSVRQGREHVRRSKVAIYLSMRLLRTAGILKAGLAVAK